jgi:hypothetical protein
VTRLGPKEKGKPRPYARKVKEDLRPDEFTKMRGFLWALAKQLRVHKLYERLWNPVNYAVVGGIGVIINYLIWLVTAGSMPWYLSNFLAILTAWSWNWANSVGPLGFLWGFEKKEEKKWLKE